MKTETKACSSLLSQHTYDAMWCDLRDERVEVPNILSNGNHYHTIQENPDMTEPTNIPSFDTESIRKLAEAGREKLQNPSNPDLDAVKSFWKTKLQENKPVLYFTAAGVLLYMGQKRLIRKETTKAITKALAKGTVRIDIPAYVTDWDAFNLANSSEKLLTETWNSGLLTKY